MRAEGTVGVYGLRLGPRQVAGVAATTTPLSLDERGPCYACIFPPIPPPNPPLSDEQIALQGTGACSDEGVLGVLCGMVGLSMCSEAVRVLLSLGASAAHFQSRYFSPPDSPLTAKPTLHLFSPLSASPFRTIKLRQRKSSCPTCASPRERWNNFLASKEWPGWEDPLCELPGVGDREGEHDLRVSARELGAMRARSQARIVDVRSPAEFGICHIPGSISRPKPQSSRVHLWLTSPNRRRSVSHSSP